MCTTLVLVALDFMKTFIIECDASIHGVGVVIMEEGRNLTLMSQQLKNIAILIYEKNVVYTTHNEAITSLLSG